MKVIVIKAASKELSKIPQEFVKDIFALFDELANGTKLRPPISCPLFSIHKGLHELRLSGRSGELRVFYIIKIEDAIYILHAHQKKTQKMERRVIELLKSRIRSQGL